VVRSVAVHDTEVVPSGKVPDDGEQLTSGVPLSSVALIPLKSTLAPEADVASSVMSGVPANAGASASAGIANRSASDAPMASSVLSRRSRAPATAVAELSFCCSN